MQELKDTLDANGHDSSPWTDETRLLSRQRTFKKVRPLVVKKLLSWRDMDDDEVSTQEREIGIPREKSECHVICLGRKGDRPIGA